MIRLRIFVGLFERSVIEHFLFTALVFLPPSSVVHRHFDGNTFPSV
jgi:hypothetical protein